MHPLASAKARRSNGVAGFQCQPLRHLFTEDGRLKSLVSSVAKERHGVLGKLQSLCDGPLQVQCRWQRVDVEGEEEEPGNLPYRPYCRQQGNLSLRRGAVKQGSGHKVQACCDLPLWFRARLSPRTTPTDP